MLQTALSDIVEITYNCLSIDGDTSTNDMVSIMANGAAENPEITMDGTEYQSFRQALYIVMAAMTKCWQRMGREQPDFWNVPVSDVLTGRPQSV